jgi:hypothetical protein
MKLSRTRGHCHSVAYRQAVHPDNVHWTQLRWERYREQRGRCAVCRRSLGFRWELHHRHYRTLGHERLHDVRAVHPGLCHWWADTARRLNNHFWNWFWSFAR